MTTSPTTSNAHALHAARYRLPQATLYHGAHAHPTSPALADRLGLPTVCVLCRADGSMDPAALARFCRRDGGRAALVVATAGTPMTGAGAVHVHVDGTSYGIVAAAAPGRPAFGFGVVADSVALSGRRILGVPAPWGVALLRAGEAALAVGGCRPPPPRAPGTRLRFRPPGWVCRKWDLALDGGRARIVATPRLTATAVDELTADLARGAAGPEERGTVA